MITEYRYASANDVSNPSGIGLPVTTSTGTNKNGDGVITMFTADDMGQILHETRHGGQNARNEFNIRTAENYGVNDEISAYRAQYSWNGSWEPRVLPTAQMTLERMRAGLDPSKITISNINQITPTIVESVVDPGFRPIYPPRNSNGTLIIPFDAWRRN